MIGTACTLGRAHRTKETRPDFHEWCRVTRHPRIFRGFDGLSTDPREMGRHKQGMRFTLLCLPSISHTNFLFTARFFLVLEYGTFLRKIFP